MYFDIFIIRQWRGCYTLMVKVARPRNAPRYKFTHADQQRELAAAKKNMELIGKEFATLDEVMEEIRQLQFSEQQEKGK